MTATNKQQYNIGAVARLTQIHPETIRVWERRYLLVVPNRTESGRRMYSNEDIERLLLVKQLTDAGHTISSLANLTNDELKERIAANSSKGSGPETQSKSIFRVMFQDETLKIRFGREILMYADMQVVDQLPENAGENSKVSTDVLVVDVATINKNTYARLREQAQQARCDSIIAIYSFGPKLIIKDLERSGITCLKTSVSAAKLRDACQAFYYSQPVLQKQSDTGVRPQLYTTEQLAKIASMTGSIACECPNHLAELIINLCAFEQYSSECENANPRDAMLHLQLNHSAGRARMTLEESLSRLIEIEGIIV